MIPDVDKCVLSKSDYPLRFRFKLFRQTFWFTFAFSFSRCVCYSNDKNLCSKALLSGVQALSKVDLQTQAEVNADFYHQYSQTSACPHAAPVKQHHQGDIYTSIFHILYQRILVSFLSLRSDVLLISALLN